MRFPVAWAHEVCEEAERVLSESKHRIVNNMIDGSYWAAFCYETAVARVQERKGIART